MEHVIIYTDGACSGNPGPGGWGALLRAGPHERELSGSAAGTTNNRMELTAVIEALRVLKRKCEVDVYTDSMYVRDGMEKWLPRWTARGWRNSDKKPIKNQDLWQDLVAEVARHHVRFHWVRGHAGHPDNERVDHLAAVAMEAGRKDT